jgi:hypothetical protein
VTGDPSTSFPDCGIAALVMSRVVIAVAIRVLAKVVILPVISMFER